MQEYKEIIKVLKWITEEGFSVTGVDEYSVKLSEHMGGKIVKYNSEELYNQYQYNEMMREQGKPENLFSKVSISTGLGNSVSKGSLHTESMMLTMKILAENP